MIDGGRETIKSATENQTAWVIMVLKRGILFEKAR